MADRIPILLLSGMAADERIFASQIEAFPELRVLPWIAPNANESLVEYAARMARLVDPGVPCIVGGASFGGVVALEMAPYLDALACVSIGSISSPEEIPLRWRVVRRFWSFEPDRIGRLARFGVRFGRPFLSRLTIRRLDKLSRPEFGFVRWALCAILDWRPSPAARRVRIYRIHGSEDAILPCRQSNADVIVPGGPHALTVFASKPVNAFIERVIREVRETASEEH